MQDARAPIAAKSAEVGEGADADSAAVEDGRPHTVALRLQRVFQLHQAEAQLLATWLEEAEEVRDVLARRIRDAAAADGVVDLYLDEMAAICLTLRTRDVAGHPALQELKGTCLGFDLARVRF